MKKLMAFALSLVFVLVLAGCTGEPRETVGIPELSEISSYTQEQLEEKLVGLSVEELHNLWGEPDGMLSGFWGDMWNLDDHKTQFITLYYDDSGYVDAIVVGTHEESEMNETIRQTRTEKAALAGFTVIYI